jgi:AraC-like DNA-binding protein
MRNIRLEFAKEKLINKTATISEIAYETGFSSPNYFSKCFKEYTSQTPKEFLENL